MSERHEHLAALEALLFVHGEPISIAKAQKILGIPPEEFSPLLNELRERLAANDRGLAIVEHDDRIQFATKPHLARILVDFVKSEISEDLSPASTEALSIIAYLGPISRSRIDFIRGVNSTFIIRSLLLRGLVERIPDPERGNSFLYRPTFELLRHLGVENQDALPERKEFISLIEQFESQPTATA